MKKTGWAAFLILICAAIIQNAAFADDDSVEAWCVGPADAPTYAFNDESEAKDCRDQVKTYGWDCRRYAKMKPCLTSQSQVDSCDSANCQCDPNLPPVGSW
jgi:hypothetical protein